VGVMTEPPPPPPFTSVADFLLEAPLYKPFTLGDDLVDLSALSGRRARDGTFLRKVDGHCSYCGRDRTFDFSGLGISDGQPWSDVRERVAHHRLILTCTRNTNHVITFWVWLENMVITKVGQWPSLADIAVDEVRAKYKSVLKGDNWSEF